MNVEFISKSNEKRYTLGIVYEPYTEDLQGDWSNEEEIAKACYSFNKRLISGCSIGKSSKWDIYTRQFVKTVREAFTQGKSVFDATGIIDDIRKGALGYNHEEWPDDIGTIVESYIMPADCNLNGQKIKKGTWMMGVVWSPEYWSKVKEGEITGYSMGGTGMRISEEVEEDGEETD